MARVFPRTQYRSIEDANSSQHDLNLTSINPSLIMGPILSTQEKKISSTSVALLANLLEGKGTESLLFVMLSLLDMPFFDQGNGSDDL